MNATTDIPLLIEELHVSYPGKKVLEGTTLSVRSGEVYGLLGRNGAGKTTLLNTVMRLLEPLKGKILLWGRPHSTPGESDLWRRVSYLGEMSGVLPHWTVRRLAAFQESCYGRLRRDWVETLFGEFGISQKSLMKSLSRGQQQMVGLVLAVAVEPDLLLLDEPAAGLDPVARRELLGKVLDLMGEKRSATLITSHILSDLERIVDRVGFLDRGRIVLEDALDDLKERCAVVTVPRDQELPPSVTVLKKRADGRLLVSGDLSSFPASAKQPLGLEDLYVELLSGGGDGR